MKYANKEAQDAFSGVAENFGKPLLLLNQSFNAAGLDVEFICAIGVDKAKLVSVYRGGFLQRQVSIECDSPAMAVKDVARGVRL
ncbi:MAG: hypothetical protein LBV17_08635 [Treponema sp.]|jgi:hypothetical protein|nr:hypothetical protein [Treponema sp.]